MALHMEKFYSAIALPVPQYRMHLETDFLKNLKKWKISGGASKSERKRAIQEAVDALEVYRKMGFSDGPEKQVLFHVTFLKYYKAREYPAISPDVSQVATEMKKIEAQYNILMKKFMLLDYWSAVAKGATEPEIPEDGAHWALHFFLNFDPVKVRPVLELMVQDAKSILSKPYSASLETWRGAEVNTSCEFTKTEMSMTIKAEASAKVGAEIKGNFEMEYKGFKMTAEAEAFAGARGSISGEVSLSAGGLEAKGSIEAEIGIHVKGNVNVDILDILELEAGIDAIAGAMAKAEAEIVVTRTGVKLDLSAEAFAGARISGEAKGTLKFGGRSILTGKAEGSLSAGIGAEAKLNVECDIFGKFSFGAKAGLTMGLGGAFGTETGIDFHNIKWGATNLFWAALNDLGFNNQGKVWLLPLEENVQMCDKVRDAMFQMLGDMYQNNELEIAKLDRWKVLENKVSQQVQLKRPRINNLMKRRNTI